jgi:UDPglucose 6-dehydrogenase
MRISILGTGYVGLVTGACLSDRGHHIICVDIDASKVDKINSVVSPIYEKGLDDLLRKNIPTRLSATTSIEEAVLSSDLSFIAVGTPFDGSSIDLTFLRTVAREIGTVLRKKNGYHLVIVKSTVVPGTTGNVVIPLLEDASGKKAGRDFGIAMNPEFLREGNAVEDFLAPDRIVIGALDTKSGNLLQEVYNVFPGADILRTNLRTAEMIKYVSNALLATLISFSNEMGNLCSATGNVDIVEVMRGVHLDKRLSPFLEDGRRIFPQIATYLAAGCGFGGSCFPKDLSALVAFAEGIGASMPILRSVMDTNRSQPQQMILALKKHFPSIEGLRVAVLGLAFKPGTDDVRESPAFPILQTLIRDGAQVSICDPMAEEESIAGFGTAVRMFRSLEEGVRGAAAILLVTAWDDFRCLPSILRETGAHTLVIDGRRMFNRNDFNNYEGIGLS